MWSLADEMEHWLKGLLEEVEDGVIELRRSELAHQFSCAPSQVTYVLTTRFVPERGFRVESRRGAGGYIRIIRLEDCDYRAYLAAQLGSHLSERAALSLTEHLNQTGLLGEEGLRLLELVLSADALGLEEPLAGEIRARLLRLVIANL
ncbi:MAG: CtsR family transcriptional regulator [Firmicutes bacterium]|jgi:transcriptional regulator CtsR|nr:CtsR family transcriptional regulator [Bacillota bacterium]